MKIYNLLWLARYMNNFAVGPSILFSLQHRIRVLLSSRWRSSEIRLSRGANTGSSKSCSVDSRPGGSALRGSLLAAVASPSLLTIGSWSWMDGTTINLTWLWCFEYSVWPECGSFTATPLLKVVESVVVRRCGHHCWEAPWLHLFLPNTGRVKRCRSGMKGVVRETFIRGVPTWVPQW